MRELVLPKFNNNDDSCVLLSWMFASGDVVPADEVVAEFETSKAVEELVLDKEAVLHCLASEEAECAFGQTVAWLFDSEPERQEYLAARQRTSAEAGPPDTASAGPGSDAAALVLTRAARELADRHGISDDQLRGLGKRILKGDDIEGLIRSAETVQAGGSLVELSRRQRAIAAVVSESHRTVPAAFAAARVQLTSFEAERARRSASGEPPAGLVEVLAKAIAVQRAELPLIFAHPHDERTVRVPEKVGVGVTIDVGTGLFIPVLPDAGGRPVDDLADQLMDFRVKALRQSFREEEFEGADITLSLHNDPGIVMARPIVYPGQTAVLTLCGTEEELFLDDGGVARTRPCVTIGLSYDHRVVNGREAVLFLRAVTKSLEDTELCAALWA